MSLNVMINLRIFLFPVLLLGLFGCGTQVSDILPDRKLDYKRQKVAEENLEVPPDLTRDSINDSMPVPGVDEVATYSAFEEQKRSGGRGSITQRGNEVLPEVESVRVVKDGGQRWLSIDNPPDEVWPRVVSFWRENGILLVEQDPAIGVMKTDWIENRADVKSDFITDFFRRSLDSIYSAGTRDQYRVRLERGEQPGSTDLFLTQRGLEEIFPRDPSGETTNSYWKARPNDPDLEAAMLRRLMVYLGVSEQRAETALAKAETREGVRSDLTKTNNDAALLIQDYFASSWRMVGLALERAGFAVEDRDRSAGIYYVRYDDPTDEKEEGFFSKLAFWRDKEEFDKEIQYRITLREEIDTTRVQVRDSKDELDSSDTAVRILTLVQENLR